MIKRALRYLADWLADQWQQLCVHDDRDVAADIMEGGGETEVKYCRRCGAVRRSFDGEWRRPRPLWCESLSDG